ncbi:hypothetical protein FY034_07180 [Trichlorobacter lovleyi]|uniref:hypothetical protein n=1 Tax=Trichlorobacter lovleyi TaxID=313985 RepID=UPI00223F2E90|nr:hypothetical protein [Trichlorobacter lovleyi]QOX78718.1 hypothetical protein FY034_07180 [Trichlorobacter lovleyi]
MLDRLFAAAGGVGSGTVLEPLLNGQYRVLYRGRKTIAFSQAGQLVANQQITIAETASGLVVVSAGSVTGGTSVEVMING